MIDDDDEFDDVDEPIEVDARRRKRNRERRRRNRLRQYMSDDVREALMEGVAHLREAEFAGDALETRRLGIRLADTVEKCVRGALDRSVTTRKHMYP